MAKNQTQTSFATATSRSTKICVGATAAIAITNAGLILGMLALSFAVNSIGPRPQITPSEKITMAEKTMGVLPIPINVPILAIGIFPEDPARLGYLDSNITGGSEKIQDIIDRNAQEGPLNATRWNTLSRFRGTGDSSTNAHVIGIYNFIYSAADTQVGPNTNFPGYYTNPPERSGKITGSVDARYILTNLLTRRTGRDICSFVDSGEVKYVFLHSWHHTPETGPFAGTEIGPIESNMSMGRASQRFWNFPTYGDVSNSGEYNDLPICNKTYVVLGGISGTGIFHLLGHQTEALLSWAQGDSGLYVDWSQPIDHQAVSWEYSLATSSPIRDMNAGDANPTPDAIQQANQRGNWGHAQVRYVSWNDQNPKYILADLSIPVPINSGNYPVSYYSGAVSDADPVYSIGKPGQVPLDTRIRRYWIADATGRRYDLKMVLWENAKYLGVKFYKPSADANIIYGCGTVHYPPNGESHYDYTGTTSVRTDCLNWDPFAPAINTTIYSCSTTGCTDFGYYTWWFQNLPGYNNGMHFGNHQVVNWWEFIDDFDAAVALHNRNLAGTYPIKISRTQALPVTGAYGMDPDGSDLTILSAFTLKTETNPVTITSIRMPYYAADAPPSARSACIIADANASRPTILSATSTAAKLGAPSLYTFVLNNSLEITANSEKKLTVRCTVSASPAQGRYWFGINGTVVSGTVGQSTPLSGIDVNQTDGVNELTAPRLWGQFLACTPFTGDINCDGVLDSIDARLNLNFQLYNTSGQQKRNEDIDCNPNTSILIDMGYFISGFAAFDQGSAPTRTPWGCNPNVNFAGTPNPVMQKGSTYNVTWQGTDRPTITLTDLQNRDQYMLCTDCSGNLLAWTVPNSIQDGIYRLRIKNPTLIGSTKKDHSVYLNTLIRVGPELQLMWPPKPSPVTKETQVNMRIQLNSTLGKLPDDPLYVYRILTRADKFLGFMARYKTGGSGFTLDPETVKVKDLFGKTFETIWTETQYARYAQNVIAQWSEASPSNDYRVVIGISDALVKDDVNRLGLSDFIVTAQSQQFTVGAVAATPPPSAGGGTLK